MVKRIAVYIIIGFGAGAFLLLLPEALPKFLTSFPTIRGMLSGIPEMRGLAQSPVYMLSEQTAPIGPPVNMRRHTYKDAMGIEQTYAWQAADNFATTKTLLVYVHGAGGDETEGFSESYTPETFHRLRIATLQRGWNYISIRNYEFDGLLTDLHARFEPQRIIMVGQSLGGRELIKHVERNPDSASGIVLACPALYLSQLDLDLVAKITMPVVIMVGEAEPQIGEFSRQLATFFDKNGTPLLFIEYPDGGHCQPFREADWAKVLDFFQPESAPNP